MRSFFTREIMQTENEADTKSLNLLLPDSYTVVSNC